MLLRLTWRVLTTPLLMVALIFFGGLGMQLGSEGGLGALPNCLPTALEFTLQYLQGLSRGDLGTIEALHPSLAGTPVLLGLRRTLPKSLGLLAVSLALATLVGLLLGVVAAYRRRTRLSELLLFTSVLGVSTPSFFVAMLLIWSLLRVYQVTGAHTLPISGFGWDAHLALPALVLAARPAATVMRLSHNALTEILEADYIRTAVAKGLWPRVLLLRHVLRNAGVPLLTTVAVSLRFSLAALPIVEYIFNWPGIGLALLKAVQQQDADAFVGMTWPVVLLFVLIGVVLEILCVVIDPRLGVSEVSGS